MQRTKARPAPGSRTRVAALLLCLLAVFAAAFFLLDTAHAQEGRGDDNDYVDVGVSLEYPTPVLSGSRYVDIIVTNHGARTAYDVEVVVDVVYPANSSRWHPTPPTAPVGTVFLENNRYSLRWTIPALGGLQREEISVFVVVFEADENNVEIYDNSLDNHEFFGEVTTASFESNLHKENNTDRIWYEVFNAQQKDSRRAKGNYYIDYVSVDEPNPSPGDIVKFTLRIRDIRGNIDRKVAIELTDGLAIDVDPNASPPREISYTSKSFSASADPSYSNGVFTIGTRKIDNRLDDVTATVPVRVASGAVVDEQCLTATITGNPPPGAGLYDDDISDNVAKLCLGQQVPSYYTSGDLTEFISHPCVGNSDHPCDNTDDVRVRAIDATTDLPLEAGTPLIHVADDSTARQYDGDTKSVNTGDIVSWQTTVQIGYEPYASEHERWGTITHNLAYEMIGKDGAFDKLHVRPAWGANDIFLNDGNRNADLFSFAPAASGANGPFDMTAEFEKLGTYKMQYTVTTTHDNNTDMDTTDDVEYSATGSYIFHVGPMTDLEVSDGGASPHVAADQNALTIVVANNDPMYEGSAQVTGLPIGAAVLYKFPDSSTYDSATGKWDIGELRVPDYYRSAGEPEPTLVLSASAGDTADVSIANSENYEVCVGSKDNPGNLTHTTQAACEAVTNASWNSTPVYDYDTDNNTATITAQAGAGGGGEGAPTLLSADDLSPSITVTWDAVDYVNGVPVSHYELQRGTNPWEPQIHEVEGTEYVDTDVNPGDTFQYRVRAVNGAGVEGPWSQPIEGSVPVPETASAGAPDAPVLTWSLPDGATGRTQIDLAWDKPVENGAPITSYTLEVSDSRNGPWAEPTPAPQLGASDTSWSHTGLTGGARKYYRMKATNSEGDSDWSAVIEATTRAPGKAGPPLAVRAAPDGDTAIDVSWLAPVDDGGSPILYYEVQWSADGATGWRNAGRTTDAVTRTFKNTGMTFGTTRYYRVAARNGVTLGDWSDPPVSATTLAGVPGQPNLTARTTDANTITLTWTVPADNGSAIIRYELEWSPDGSANSWTNLTNPAAADTSYSDSGLDPGTERHYRIRAINGASPGEGSWSTSRSAVTPPAVPGAPTLSATANGQNAIDITWEPPSDDGGADVTGYELHWSATGAENSYARLTSPSASARSYTHGGLQPGDTRYYQLRARNRAGLGEFSQPTSATTLTGVPAAPGLTVRANGATEIRLTWTEPDDRGSSITGYEVQESDDGSAWSSLSFPSGSDTEYVHTGLSGGTTKHYRVRAVNGNGDGAWSATRNARTDAGGPDAPVLTLTVAGDNQIDLTWTVPANNGSAIRGYWVERSADGDEPWERLSSNTATTSYSDDDLYRGMTRHYRVAAFNGAGTGPYSNVESATTTGDPATAPEPPTLLRFSAISRNQVTIAWDLPTDHGGAPISGYEYEVARPCPPPATGTCDFTGNDIKATTSTSVSITGLNAQGDYYFQVRAVNPVGKGDWSGDIRATLTPSLSGLLQVSPVTVNVDEGSSASYTVRLSHAPAHPVYLHIAASGPSEADDVMEAVRAYEGHYLVPDGWTHPGGQDWSGFTHNWRQGVRVQFTAPEDADADNDVAAFSHFVYAVSHSHLGLAEADWRQDWYDSTAYNLVECTANCDDANPANHSVQRNTLTGAGVKVTVRDND